MKLWRRVVRGVLVAAVGVPLLFVGVLNTNAWYYRWRAGQLLAALKTVRPGETTESDYLRLIRPFAAASYEVVRDGEDRHDVLAIGNRSEWIARTLNGKGHLLGDLLSGHLIPPVVAFEIIPTYEGGLVSRLELESDTPISGHAPGAFVHWSASRYEGDEPRLRDEFSGYAVSQVGPPREAPWEFFITMDERATAEERSRALSFSFRCFTRVSMCKDAAMYLNPSPNR